MDDTGYIYLVDRAKDMIIVGGYKVFSSEVENTFHEHPAIGLCALVGSPDPKRPDSEIITRVVQKSEAWAGRADDEVKAKLIAFARENLSPYKVPKIVRFIDAIPMTSVGKMNKKALRG